MRPSTTTIGLCAVVQLVVIASGWLLTRSFRKIYLVTSEQGLLEPSPGFFSSHFATQGWMLLPFPLLWCAWMIWRIRKDSEHHHSTAATGKVCIILTLVVFVACTWLTKKMMSAAFDPREVPLRIIHETP
ncbi:MAG: hypothetical protein U1F71_09530 [Verrucomicrobiaceae bacterium]